MRGSWWTGALLFVFVLLLDIVTKGYASQTFPFYRGGSYPYGGVALFTDLFGIEGSLVYTTNKGAAWGAFASFSSLLLFLRILLVFVLAIYIFWLNKIARYTLPLLLILAGAVGNILDTFLYGAVVDMFKFVFWGYHYPIFNVADIAITLGVAWLLLLSFFSEKKELA